MLKPLKKIPTNKPRMGIDGNVVRRFCKVTVSPEEIEANVGRLRKDAEILMSKGWASHCSFLQFRNSPEVVDYLQRSAERAKSKRVGGDLEGAVDYLLRE